MKNEWTEEIEKLEEERAKALKLLRASSAGLKSYQYGNSSPDLAEHIAREIDSFLSMSGMTS